MPPRPPKCEVESARRSWADAAPDIVTGAVGLALVIFAIWGLWIAADVARPAGDPNPNIAAAERNLTATKFFLTWLVLFAPFFLLGAAILWSTFRKNYSGARIWGLIGTINQITPFWRVQSRYGRMAGQFESYEMEKPLPGTLAAHQPLDEETVQRVDRAAYLAAKSLGLLVGGVLALGGAVGFVLEWLDAYRPATYVPGTYRFTASFLIVCVLAVVMGIIVLRDTLRPEQRAWLGPLRMFSYIVGLRVVADILKEDHNRKSGDRTFPGIGPQKALAPPRDSRGDGSGPEP